MSITVAARSEIKYFRYTNVR